MKQPVAHNAHSLKRFARPIAIGVAVGAAVCALLLLLVSALMIFRDIPQSIAAFFVTLILAVGSFSAGFASAFCARERGLPIGLCCGMAMFLPLCLIWTIVDGTGLSAQAFAKLATVLFSAAIGGVFGVNKKRSFKKT